VINRKQFNVLVFEPVNNAVIPEDDLTNGGIPKLRHNPPRFWKFRNTVNCLKNIDDKETGVLGGVFVNEL